MDDGTAARQPTVADCMNHAHTEEAPPVGALCITYALRLFDAFHLIDEQMENVTCGGDALRRLVGQTA